MRSIAAGTSPAGATQGGEAVSPLIAATAQSLPEQAHALVRARAFAEPLLANETMETGENTLAHADAVASILKGIGGSEAMQAASYLVHACVHLNRPEEVIAKAFGENFATLAVETTKLMRVQEQARGAEASGQPGGDVALLTESVLMLLVLCSWCFCAWRRACRRCASTPRASARCRPAWRARRCTSSRRWPTAWASGR